VKIGELALHSMLARAIQSKCSNTKVLWFSRVGWTVSASKHEFGRVEPVVPLGDLSRLRAAAAERLDDLATEVAKVSAEIAKLTESIKGEKDPGAKAKLEKDRKEKEAWLSTLKARQPLVVAYETLNKAADELLSAVAKLAADEKGSLFERLQSAATLLDRLSGIEPEKVLFLTSETTVAGGSYRTRKNLFTSMFSGDLLSYSGGAAVAFALFNGHAQLVASDTLTTFTGFGKFSKKAGTFNYNNWEAGDPLPAGQNPK
jgi:hypothetical protein